MNEQTDSNDIAESHWGFEGARGWGLFWCGLQYGQCVAEAAEGEGKKKDHQLRKLMHRIETDCQR